MQIKVFKKLLFLSVLVFLFSVLATPLIAEEQVGEGLSPQMEGVGKGKRGNKHNGKMRQQGKRGKAKNMLQRKQRFLKFSKEYYQSVKDPHGAIGFAVLGIKEKYRRAGKPLKAVAELEKVLKLTNDRGARNIVLFTIRQVYERAKNADGLAQVNDQIIKENLAALAK